MAPNSSSGVCFPTPESGLAFPVALANRMWYEWHSMSSRAWPQEPSVFSLLVYSCHHVRKPRHKWWETTRRERLSWQHQSPQTSRTETISDPPPSWAPSWWQLPEEAPEHPAEQPDLAQPNGKTWEQTEDGGFKLLSSGVLCYGAIDNWYIREVSVFRKSSSRKEETSKIIIFGFFFFGHDKEHAGS